MRYGGKHVTILLSFRYHKPHDGGDSNPVCKGQRGI